MKTSKIVDAMGYIDDDLITASIDYKPRKIKMKWIPYAAAAACAACFCILAVRISGFDPAVSSSTGSEGNTMGEIFAGGYGTGDVSAENGGINSAGAASGDITGGALSGIGTTGTTPVDKPGSGQPGDPTISYGGMPGSSKPGDPTTSYGEKPNAYLSTKPVTFSTAKEQVKFTEVKEVSGENFVGYELDYVMPSETLIALTYVYTDGYVSVADNSGDWGGKIAISPGQWYEKIERDNMVFWKSTVTDPPAAVYISESDIAYFGMFESDADLSKAIDTIISLIKN